MSPRSTRPSVRRLSTVVIGLALVFVVLALLAWQRWSSDAVTSVDNSPDAVVQPARVPPPGGARPARPVNNGIDGTGDAVVRRDAPRP
jgi:hypothetical protein